MKSFNEMRDEAKKVAKAYVDSAIDDCDINRWVANRLESKYLEEECHGAEERTLSSKAVFRYACNLEDEKVLKLAIDMLTEDEEG